MLLGTEDGKAYSEGQLRDMLSREVDFIVYGSMGIFAIEVRNAGRIYPQDLKSLKSFTQDYSQSKAFLLYRGRERLLRDGILCLPCEEFLSALRPGVAIGENM